MTTSRSLARKGLVEALRTRISDDRPTATAFSIQVEGAKSALLEVANGFFVATVEGGEKAKSIRLNLSLPSYSTIGKLANAISKLPGYKVTVDPQYQPDHPSIDLRMDEGIVEIGKGETATLRHRIFSDEELTSFLSEAISLHNPSYSISSVPPAEQVYVLLKAAARAYRVLAGDSVKRKGLDAEAKDLITLAQDLDTQYEKDTKRQHRVIPATRIDDSRIGTGDAVQGNLVRRSMRAGYTTPYRGAIPVDPPTLLDPADDDSEDTTIRVRWLSSRELNFSHYELWRDTQPNVERSIAGRIEHRSSVPSPQLPVQTQYSRATTSRQVMGLTVGSNRIAPVFDGFFFWTAAELAGSNLVNVSFIDGIVQPNPGAGSISVLGEPLEPDTDYYYRLYGIDWNGEIFPSAVVKIRTRPFRARFKRVVNGMIDPTAITPTTGPIAGGTSITILGTNFVVGTEVFLNGKKCTEVSRTATEIVVTSPAFTNTEFVGKTMDLVLKSPSNLLDIAQRAWVYTA